MRSVGVSRWVEADSRQEAAAAFRVTHGFSSQVRFWDSAETVSLPDHLLSPSTIRPGQRIARGRRTNHHDHAPQVPTQSGFQPQALFALGIAEPLDDDLVGSQEGQLNHLLGRVRDSLKIIYHDVNSLQKTIVAFEQTVQAPNDPARVLKETQQWSDSLRQKTVRAIERCENTIFGKPNPTEKPLTTYRGVEQELVSIFTTCANQHKTDHILKTLEALAQDELAGTQALAVAKALFDLRCSVLKMPFADRPYEAAPADMVLCRMDKQQNGWIQQSLTKSQGLVAKYLRGSRHDAVAKIKSIRSDLRFVERNVLMLTDPLRNFGSAAVLKTTLERIIDQRANDAALSSFERQKKEVAVRLQNIYRHRGHSLVELQHALYFAKRDVTRLEREQFPHQRVITSALYLAIDKFIQELNRMIDTTIYQPRTDEP